MLREKSLKIGLKWKSIIPRLVAHKKTQTTNSCKKKRMRRGLKMRMRRDMTQEIDLKIIL